MEHFYIVNSSTSPYCSCKIQQIHLPDCLLLSCPELLMADPLCSSTDSLHDRQCHLAKNKTWYPCHVNQTKAILFPLTLICAVSFCGTEWYCILHTGDVTEPRLILWKSSVSKDPTVQYIWCQHISPIFNNEDVNCSQTFQIKLSHKNNILKSWLCE